MSLSVKGLLEKDAKLNLQEKITTLNPNAAEFIPYSLRSVSGSTKELDVKRLNAPETSGKAVLDQSELNVSNSSDDEVHRFWHRQLPDDIIPDFKVMEEDKLQGPNSISLAGLAIHDGAENAKFPASVSSQLSGQRQEMWNHGSDSTSLGEKLRYTGFTHAEAQSSKAFMKLASNHWEKQLMNVNLHLTSGNEGELYDGNSSAADFLYDQLDENSLENPTSDLVGFLASQFPGFAAASLANAYDAHGHDLKLTIKFLKQLEVQVHRGFNENLNSKSISASTLSVLDFPSLPGPDAQRGLSKYSGDDLQHVQNSRRLVEKGSFPFLNPMHGTSRNTPDFASAVQKLESQDSYHWKPERNGSVDGSFGESTTSQIVPSSFNGHGKLVYGDKLHSSGAVRAAPFWLQTGEAVESREEARDLACLQNAFLEQVRQAYVIGNMALAKELSAKGQLYYMQMKAANDKAREFIYHDRNPVIPGQSYGHGQDPLIDLHGLHVSEALHVLKHELNVLRRTARSAGRHLQAIICLGTGHHIRGSRAPAKLPFVVEQYLVEEGLQYNEPQPGLLRVVIH